MLFNRRSADLKWKWQWISKEKIEKLKTRKEISKECKIKGRNKTIGNRFQRKREKKWTAQNQIKFYYYFFRLLIQIRKKHDI